MRVSYHSIDPELTVAASRMARDRGDVRIAHQFLPYPMIRPGARVSRDAIQFLRDRFAYAVDHDFAKQP